MIELLTGLPGSGKSLFAVKRIRDEVMKGRPVYVHGVDGLVPMGQQGLSDPRKWQDLPDGAFIVVDEAQEIWPTRRSGDPAPEVRALSKHRHRGFDFLLISQKPTFLDSYVRGLAARHVYLVRMWGAQASRSFEWLEAQEDPKSTAVRAKATKSVWRYPKDCYALYKSATMHTVKRRLPLRLALVPVVAVGIAIGAWVAYDSFSGLGDTSEAGPPDAAAAAPPGLLARTGTLIGGSRSSVRGDDAPLTPLQYLDAHSPRVAVWPWSAPLYDGRQVASDPQLYCVSTADTCRCYTEQVTPYSGIDGPTCRHLARHGVYNPYREPHRDPEGERGRDNGSQGV